MMCVVGGCFETSLLCLGQDPWGEREIAWAAAMFWWTVGLSALRGLILIPYFGSCVAFVS